MAGLAAGAAAGAMGFGAGVAGVVCAIANETQRLRTVAAISLVKGLDIEISL
jgi:hypothetical protein